MSTAHLVLVSDRAALSWVLTEQRMAFPPIRAQAVREITEGDEVFLYSTRSCFGNPNRDVGRVIAAARVTEAPRTLEEPIVFGERRFTEGCALTIHGLAPFRTGLALRDHVEELTVFPDPKTWSVRLRRASVQLPAADADFLRTALRPHLKPYTETVDAYRWLR